jgi:hypothetical protein
LTVFSQEQLEFEPEQLGTEIPLSFGAPPDPQPVGPLPGVEPPLPFVPGLEELPPLLALPPPLG